MMKPYGWKPSWEGCQSWCRYLVGHRRDDGSIEWWWCREKPVVYPDDAGCLAGLWAAPVEGKTFVGIAAPPPRTFVEERP